MTGDAHNKLLCFNSILHSNFQIVYEFQIYLQFRAYQWVHGALAPNFTNFARTLNKISIKQKSCVIHVLPDVYFINFVLFITL